MRPGARWCDAALCACAWRPELLMGASLRSRSAMLVLIVVEGGWWFVAVANPGAETVDDHRSRPKKRRFRRLRPLDTPMR